MPLRLISLPCDRRFLDACAQRLLALAEGPDLSRVCVVLPNLMLAQPLREALAAQAGRALILPPMQTLPSIIAPWLEGIAHLPDSRRALTLYEALRGRRWFDEGSLWGVCDELVALFDELTLDGATLPQDVAQFETLLARAYECQVSEPLRFEARLAVELWHAEGQGALPRAAARMAAAAQWASALATPLVVLAEGEPGAFERKVYAACAERVPVTLCVPDRRQDAALPLLELAWPVRADPTTLGTRLATHAHGPSLRERVGIVACDSLESTAVAVVSRVREWLLAGRRRIALVAVDRAAARRARALLERERILVADESGWKLSTTRAAALLDAILEVLDGEAYHRDLADLLKSPFVLADVDPAVRSRGALGLERVLAEANVASGWPAVEEALRCSGQAELRVLLERLQALRRAMPLGVASASVWLQRVGAAIDALGARQALQADAAGAQLLEWLAGRAAELAGERLSLSFVEWRQWLDGGLEAAMFRDSSIDSPVVMTHLAATRLRSFEAAVVIGADAGNLTPSERRPVFAHDRVREELGLPGREAARLSLQDDLASLIAHSDECVFVWQRLVEGEAQLLSPPLELLSVTHQVAFGDPLLRAAPVCVEPAAEALALPAAAPVLPPALWPERVSASGFASLLACPYQYYAGRLLRLERAEEVSEELEKRDYGELVHRVLHEAHSGIPLFSALPREQLLERLARISDSVFAPVVARNYLELGWFARWQRILADYAEWQCAREADGWRFLAGEQSRRLRIGLAGGREIELEGRLDRIDARSDGALAVLDYKARELAALRRSVADADDVQLAVYAALAGGEVAEAAYVSVDGKAGGAVALPEPHAAAQRQVARLVAALEAILGGAPMAAHGNDEACRYCEMAGLCRREHRG